MNNNAIWAIVFLMAGTLLTVGGTTMIPAAYAGGDDDDDNGDGNKNKAEDDSAAAIADCDDNDVERAGFDCFGIAVNGLELD
jgi:hypothetical protein